jgi:Arc/MetJ-type ribon-helix-helix transcriptional regulator
VAKVMISLPEEFLRRIDREARTQGRSRSELIREALRRLIDDRGGRSLSWSKAVTSLRRLESEWIDRWDSTDVIRRDRESRHGREDRR